MKISQLLKINAVGSVLLYSALIVTTLCLSAIALGVDVPEALSSSPTIEETLNAENYR